MEAFIQGWGLTIALCGFIVLVFLAGWLHVHRELAWVKALTDHLGDELVSAAPAKPRSLELQALRDEAHAILTAHDPAWAQKQVRTWQMRAFRLEPVLAFWVDLLRQLGLLGTVLGIGLSLMYTGSDVTKLLGPLALKVWTTVTGLSCSDHAVGELRRCGSRPGSTPCEKNLEAWDARRHTAKPEPRG